MSDPLYRTDPYAREAVASVVAVTPEAAIVPDLSIFYPTGGGQPGDSGWIVWDGGRVAVTEARKAEDGGVKLILEPGAAVPPIGAAIRQELDWARRYIHMRVHTALHLLSVVLPFPVTGGQIGPGRGRLDFAMEAVPEDRDAVEAALNAHIEADHAVTEEWITDAQLAANPSLVKTMSVMPPTGQGRVRLIRIGAGETEVDLQPCGGTHVARTAEIRRLKLGKIENKGRQNRRVTIELADP